MREINTLINNHTPRSSKIRNPSHMLFFSIASVLFLAIGFSVYRLYIKDKSNSLFVDQLVNSSFTKSQKCDFLDLVYEISTENNVAAEAELVCVNGTQGKAINVIDNYYEKAANSHKTINGNLYVLTISGYDGFQDEDWTQELWRYTTDGKGDLLYSEKGFAYEVSPDEKVIYIETISYVLLLDESGKILQKFSSEELLVNPSSFSLLEFYEDVIWLDNAFGPTLTGLVSIDLADYSIDKFDLSGLNTGIEYTVSPDSKYLAYSDYPALFDVDGLEDFAYSGTPVTLSILDLTTLETTTVATSIAKRFYPSWTGTTTLTYSDPDSEDKLEYIVGN